MHPFTVVSDPVRRRIVEVLARGERTAGDVVDVVRSEFGISQSAVSQQLKVLRDHGFARVRPDGARRIYALEPAAVGAMDAWLRGVGAFWADRLDDLAAEVEPKSRLPAAVRASTLTVGRLASVSRSVRDVAESADFYGGIIGLPHLVTATDYAAFDLGGTRLLLVRQERPAGDESLLAFTVQELASHVASMRAAGVVLRPQSSVAHDRVAEGDGRAVYFDDPEGRPLALVAQGAPQT